MESANSEGSAEKTIQNSATNFSLFEFFLFLAQKAYFNLHLVCAAPKRWSKYTTGLFNSGAVPKSKFWPKICFQHGLACRLRGSIIDGFEIIMKKSHHCKCHKSGNQPLNDGHHGHHNLGL